MKIQSFLTPTFLLAAVLLTACSTGPTAVPDKAIGWQVAGGRIGETTTVVGPVVDTHFADDHIGRPVYVNVGNAYPNEDRFTYYVWGEDREKFPEPPESVPAGTTVAITGVIEEVGGVPHIKVTDPGQIVYREPVN